MSSMVKLLVGQLESDGKLTAGSMALAIEDAMVAQVPYGPNEDPLGRRRFALAIAQGVIDHLCANAGAIVTTVRDNTGTGTHEQPATQIDKW